MRELTSLMEFISELDLNQLADASNSIKKKFGEFSFPCGCGSVHTISKKNYPHPSIPTQWNDSTDTVYSILSEPNRLLFSCKHGYFTMVRLEQSFLKKNVCSDFTINRKFIDQADEGFGLFIHTPSYNLDFNLKGTRELPIPIHEVESWTEFEELILETEKSKISRLPKFMPELNDTSFICPCGDKHFMTGREPTIALQQGPKKSFCYPHLNCNDTKFLFRCYKGFYSMIRIRPSMPVEWYYKSDIMPESRRTDTLLEDDIFSELTGLRLRLTID